MTMAARRLALVSAIGVSAVTAGSLYVATTSDDPLRFCFSDGLVGADGDSYGRDPDQRCRFVDANGAVVAELNGAAICYDDAGAVLRGSVCD